MMPWETKNDGLNIPPMLKRDPATNRAPYMDAPEYRDDATDWLPLPSPSTSLPTSAPVFHIPPWASTDGARE